MDLVTDHQESERERLSNQSVRLWVFVQLFPHSPCCIYTEGTSRRLSPVLANSYTPGRAGGLFMNRPRRFTPYLNSLS